MKIRDIVTKPSQAIHAMCSGLERQSQREDFIVDMYTFGYSDKDFCYGCAATCAVQEIAGKNLLPSDFSIGNDLAPWALTSRVLNLELQEVAEFEKAIDEARCGNLTWLFHFFGIKEYQDESIFEHEWLEGVARAMSTDNWRDLIPAYREIAKKLASEGY